jgi:SAM-dependent methyltransferase
LEEARENCTAVEDPQSVRYGKQSGLQSKRGYTNLTAMDLSAGMLERARKKNADAEFHCMTIGKPFGFPPDSFDGVISVGVLTVGHAPVGEPNVLHQLWVYQINA